MRARQWNAALSSKLLRSIKMFSQRKQVCLWVRVRHKLLWSIKMFSQRKQVCLWVRVRHKLLRWRKQVYLWLRGRHGCLENQHHSWRLLMTTRYRLFWCEQFTVIYSDVTWFQIWIRWNPTLFPKSDSVGYLKSDCNGFKIFCFCSTVQLFL